MTLRARLIAAAEAAHRRGEHVRREHPLCEWCAVPVRVLPPRDQTGTVLAR